MRSGAVLQLERLPFTKSSAAVWSTKAVRSGSSPHTLSFACTLHPAPPSMGLFPPRDLSGPSPPDSHHTNLGGSYILSWKERTISVCFFFPPPFTCGPGSTMIFNVRNEEQPHLGSGVRSTDSRCVLVGLEQRGEQPQASTKNLNTSYRRLFRVISTLH